MEIKTNNQPRLLSDWDEIPEHVRNSDFDYLSDDDAHGRDFVQYKGQWYDLNEFMLAPESLQRDGWEGFTADSAFSGVAVRYCENDRDHVIMATMLS